MSGYIYAKFLGKEIMGESGRLLFSLLNAFSGCGYKIRLVDTMGLDPVDRNGRLTLSMKGLEISDEPPANYEESFYLFDEEDSAFTKKKWKAKIQVKFDIFSSYWLRRKPVLMPYPMHPVHWGHHGGRMDEYLAQLRNGERRLRLFFSGDTKGYQRPKVSYPNIKLSRPEVIETLLAGLCDKAESVSDEARLAGLFASPYTNKCVILDTGKLWVDDALWLERLAAADFFLAPPGICMPMCHNAVEAMAVGAIPFISYPEWFSPKLEHMKNCVVFSDAADLVAKAELVLRMDAAAIAAMRARVIEYYEGHLRPEGFVQRVENVPTHTATVLMITERYVAKNAKKLGRRSVLLRACG